MTDAYRYECPECESVDVRIRRQTSADECMHGGIPAESKWYCRGCDSSLEKVLDKKLNRMVRRPS